MISFGSETDSTATATLERKPSRYRAQCPACRKRIEAGAWVIPMAGGGRRPRWRHEDCDAAALEAERGGSGSSIDNAALMELVAQTKAAEKRLAKLEAAAPKRVAIAIADLPEVEVDSAHVALVEVVELLANREPVFLPGPAGCGKSHLASQAAEVLALPFRSISCSAGMSEAQLLGRCIPRGTAGQFEFVATPFLECYETGGVFLFDELDAADPNVLLVVNSALANGFLDLPSRPENPRAKRHADFCCIAAANTYGRGADRLYCGRNQLDEATLDRFRIGTVPVDYDRDLEQQLWVLIAGGRHSHQLEWLWRTRDKVCDARLERIVSTRFILAAARAFARGKDWDYVLAKLTSGWRADEVAKLN
jgi:cobaltochelatase CobS